MLARSSKPSPPPANLLSDLPDRVSAELLASALPRHLFSACEVLFLAGDPGDGFYRLDEGLLKVSIASPSGGDRILAISGPGSVVGDLTILDCKPRSAAVSALHDCKLQFISRRVFEAFAAQNPEMYRYFAAILATRLRDTDQIVAAESFLPLKGCVACALLDLAHAFGQNAGGNRLLIRQNVLIRQNMSQSDLAAMAGIARKHFSRTVNEWMRMKVVTRLSGYYCLEDPEKLQREVDL